MEHLHNPQFLPSRAGHSLLFKSVSLLEPRSTEGNKRDESFLANRFIAQPTKAAWLLRSFTGSERRTMLGEPSTKQKQACHAVEGHAV